MDLIQTILPSLLDGLKMTLKLFFIIGISSIPLGFLIAVIRVYGPKWLGFSDPVICLHHERDAIAAAIDVCFLRFAADRHYVGSFFFGSNSGIYDQLCRLLCGNLPWRHHSRPRKGSSRAISVLGIGKVRGFFKIIIPQVTKIVLPSVGNEVIALVKRYIFGLLSSVSGNCCGQGRLPRNTYASLVPFLAVGIVYFIRHGCHYGAAE